MALRLLPAHDPDPRPASPGVHLGPYETAYDVRRGYDAPPAAAAPGRREERTKGWMGRRAER